MLNWLVMSILEKTINKSEGTHAGRVAFSSPWNLDHEQYDMTLCITICHSEYSRDTSTTSYGSSGALPEVKMNPRPLVLQVFFYPHLPFIKIPRLHLTDFSQKTDYQVLCLHYFCIFNRMTWPLSFQAASAFIFTQGTEVIEKTEPLENDLRNGHVTVCLSEQHRIFCFPVVIFPRQTTKLKQSLRSGILFQSSAMDIGHCLCTQQLYAE